MMNYKTADSVKRLFHFSYCNNFTVRECYITKRCIKKKKKLENTQLKKYSKGRFSVGYCYSQIF